MDIALPTRENALRVYLAALPPDVIQDDTAHIAISDDLQEITACTTCGFRSSIPDSFHCETNDRADYRWDAEAHRFYRLQPENTTQTKSIYQLYAKVGYERERFKITAIRVRHEDLRLPTICMLQYAGDAGSVQLGEFITTNQCVERVVRGQTVRILTSRFFRVVSKTYDPNEDTVTLAVDVTYTNFNSTITHPVKKKIHVLTLRLLFEPEHRAFANKIVAPIADGCVDPSTGGCVSM